MRSARGTNNSGSSRDCNDRRGSMNGIAGEIRVSVRTRSGRVPATQTEIAPPSELPNRWTGPRSRVLDPPDHPVGHGLHARTRVGRVAVPEPRQVDRLAVEPVGEQVRPGRSSSATNHRGRGRTASARRRPSAPAYAARRSSRRPARSDTPGHFATMPSSCRELGTGGEVGALHTVNSAPPAATANAGSRRRVWPAPRPGAGRRRRWPSPRCCSA